MPGMVICAIFVGVGVLILLGARSLSPLGAVFPATIGVILIVLSLAFIALGLLGRTPAPVPAAGSGGGPVRRIGLAAIMLAYVVLLPVIGFFVTSLAAFFATMVVADYDRPGVRTWLIWAATGVAIVAGFWWLMANVLLLRMPAGILF